MIARRVGIYSTTHITIPTLVPAISSPSRLQLAANYVGMSREPAVIGLEALMVQVFYNRVVRFI